MNGSQVQKCYFHHVGCWVKISNLKTRRDFKNYILFKILKIHCKITDEVINGGKVVGQAVGTGCNRFSNKKRAWWIELGSRVLD